jgi:hypothetical protein
MAATAQVGTTLKIGFGTSVYTGYIMEEHTVEATGEQTVIKDEDAATVTILVSDLGQRRSFTAIIKNVGGSLTPPVQGADITINSVVYRVESSNVKQTRGASMLTVSCIKEASMSYA